MKKPLDINEALQDLSHMMNDFGQGAWFCGGGTIIAL
jgi:hypothetical protein